MADPDPVLPQRSTDETDQGWGDEDRAEDRDEELRRQRPPHHRD